MAKAAARLTVAEFPAWELGVGGWELSRGGCERRRSVGTPTTTAATTKTTTRASGPSKIRNAAGIGPGILGSHATSASHSGAVSSRSSRRAATTATDPIMSAASTQTGGSSPALVVVCWLVTATTPNDAQAPVAQATAAAVVEDLTSLCCVCRQECG